MSVPSSPYQTKSTERLPERLWGHTQYNQGCSVPAAGLVWAKDKHPSTHHPKKHPTHTHPTHPILHPPPPQPKQKVKKIPTHIFSSHAFAYFPNQTRFLKVKGLKTVDAGNGPTYGSSGCWWPCRWSWW